MFIQIDEDNSVNPAKVRRLIRNPTWPKKTNVVYGPGDVEILDVPYETLLEKLNGLEPAAPQRTLRVDGPRPGTCGKIPPPTGRVFAEIASLYWELRPCHLPNDGHVQCLGYVRKADELGMRISYTWPTKDAVPAGTR